jgi:hypothetical protein
MVLDNKLDLVLAFIQLLPFRFFVIAARRHLDPHGSHDCNDSLLEQCERRNGVHEAKEERVEMEQGPPVKQVGVFAQNDQHGSSRFFRVDGPWIEWNKRDSEFLYQPAVYLFVCAD